MVCADIRLQLAEQSRVLEARAEATCGVAGELHDYCRRRADLEHEYARALDKLTRAAHQRHKDQKHKSVPALHTTLRTVTILVTDHQQSGGHAIGFCLAYPAWGERPGCQMNYFVHMLVPLFYGGSSTCQLLHSQAFPSSTRPF